MLNIYFRNKEIWDSEPTARVDYARLCTGALSIPHVNPHITLRDRNLHNHPSPGDETSQAEG